MSSEATGWVLRHGPRDRAMRYVLLTIADAANRDGEHSHPGIAAMCEQSLYGRAHVMATVDKLVSDGWLEVEEAGGGRGRATVYRIPGLRGKVQPLDPSPNGKGPVTVQPEPDRLSDERVQSGEGAPSYANRKNQTTHTADDAAGAVVVATPVEVLCALLSQRISEHMQQPRPAVSARWLTDMRLLVERGPLGQEQPSPIPPETVQRAIDVVFGQLATPGRDGFCWATQIRSPRALRQHWHQLREAKRRTVGGRPMSPREQRIAANGVERFAEAAEPMTYEELARRIKQPEELCPPSLP